MRRRSFLAGSAATLASLPVAPAQADDSSIKFPRDFLWGVASSAFQTEGGLHADGRGVSIWDDVAADASRRTAELAADHYRQWRDDVGLLEQLGVNAYRFSVAWPRILPEGVGEVNPRGVDFYDRLVDRLLNAGITPLLCLYHWDLPKRVQDKGGWRSREIIGSFTEYARTVADRLGDRVQHWIAINEAYAIAYGGYAIAYWPPFVADEESYFAVAHHLNLAQGAVFKALAKSGRKFGTAMTLNPVRPSTRSSEDVSAARFHEAMSTKLFLDPLMRGSYPELVEKRVAPFIRGDDLSIIRHSVDFIGINYYEPEYRRSLPGAPFNTEGTVPSDIAVTDSGALIEPDGLYEELMQLRDQYGNPPVYVTENGAAFEDHVGMSFHADDAKRIAFLREHVLASHRALSDGANLKGYFVWSFLDSFEWRFGFKTRYGLVYVDEVTGRRSPKSSFDWYAKVVRRGFV
jgi:beta-glucosidase